MIHLSNSFYDQLPAAICPDVCIFSEALQVLGQTEDEWAPRAKEPERRPAWERKKTPKEQGDVVASARHLSLPSPRPPSSSPPAHRPASHTSGGRRGGGSIYILAHSHQRHTVPQLFVRPPSGLLGECVCVCWFYRSSKKWRKTCNTYNKYNKAIGNFPF